MNHQLIKIFVLLFVLLGSFTQPLFAAGLVGLSLVAPTSEVYVGDFFEVIVQANSSDVTIDTIRMVATYDPSIVRAEMVSLIGPFDHSAPGNYIDNKTGKIFWGGFNTKGGVSQTNNFARITFSAIKEGDATVKISSDSRMIADGVEKMQEGARGKGLGEVEIKILGAVGSADGDMKIKLESTSHPEENVWSKSNTINVSWKNTDTSKPVKEYLYTFDETPNTIPTTGELPQCKGRQCTFKVVKDGIYYFHLGVLLEDGTRIKTIHQRFNIDTVAPNAIALITDEDKILEGEALVLTFATTDETSGVSQYQIALNDGPFETQTSPYELKDLKAGTYFIRVAAIDRAGNIIYGSTNARVYPKDTILDRPQIQPTESPSSISSLRGVTRQSNLVLTVIALVTVVLIIIAVFIKRRKK